MIPHGWKPETLNEGIELISGRHVLAKDYSDDSSGIPYITGPSDFSNGVIFATKYTSHPDVLCQEGDSLVTVKGSGTGQVVFSDRIYCISRQLMAVRSKKYNDKFLFYFLSYSSPRYEQLARGLIPGISREDVLFTPILVPPLPEQNKIAKILSAWDEAITKTEQLIAALRERKKGLMQKLLSGQVRFAGFEISKAKQETRYGEIPVDWNYVTIDSVAHQVTAKNNNDDELPVLSCTKYDGLVDSLTYFGRQIFSEDTSTYKIVKRGQFAYATNHIEEGSIGYQNLHDRALISPMYTVFETNDKVDDGFLYKLLKTELYRHIFEVNTSASINRRGSLRWNIFAQIRIPLPSLKEQKAIADALDTCEQEILITKKRWDAFQQQKKGLMQRLLTGEIRVKV